MFVHTAHYSEHAVARAPCGFPGESGREGADMLYVFGRAGDLREALAAAGADTSLEHAEAAMGRKSNP